MKVDLSVWSVPPPLLLSEFPLEFACLDTEEDLLFFRLIVNFLVVGCCYV